MEEPQKKHQCTREELQQRVKYCLDLLRRHVLSDGTILTHRRIASLAAQQFNVSVRTAWRYLKRADEKFQQDEGLPRRARANWVSDYLEHVMINTKTRSVTDENGKSHERPAVAVKDRLVAARLYIDLHGLAAPIKTAQTNVDGEDIPPPRTPAQDRAELTTLLEQVETNKGA